MLKKKALNRIFITTIIFFVVFTIYSLIDIPVTEEIKKENKEELSSIYTLNDDGYISKTEVYVSKAISLEDKIKEKLEIMIEENNKNALLPSYFNPILPENTKIEEVIVEDSLVKIYFSKELLNITESQSEQMIEAIVYTITDEEILGIEIYVEESLLKYVPHTNKQLPTILTKDFGINKTYEISSNKDIVKLVMSYYGKENDEYYEIPVTKYLNDDREKIEIIIEELDNIKANTNLLTLVENIKLLDYEINKNSLTINLNKDLSEEEETILLKSIFNNYDVEKIEILVQNEKKQEKIKKDIEK